MSSPIKTFTDIVSIPVNYSESPSGVVLQGNFSLNRTITIKGPKDKMTPENIEIVLDTFRSVSTHEYNHVYSCKLNLSKEDIDRYDEIFKKSQSEFEIQLAKNNLQVIY